MNSIVSGGQEVVDVVMLWPVKGPGCFFHRYLKTVQKPPWFRFDLVYPPAEADFFRFVIVTVVVFVVPLYRNETLQIATTTTIEAKQARRAAPALGQQSSGWRQTPRDNGRQSRRTSDRRDNRQPVASAMVTTLAWIEAHMIPTGKQLNRNRCDGKVR